MLMMLWYSVGVVNAVDSVTVSGTDDHAVDTDEASSILAISVSVNIDNATKDVSVADIAFVLMVIPMLLIFLLLIMLLQLMMLLIQNMMLLMMLMLRLWHNAYK